MLIYEVPNNNSDDNATAYALIGGPYESPEQMAHAMRIFRMEVTQSCLGLMASGVVAQKEGSLFLQSLGNPYQDAVANRHRRAFDTTIEKFPDGIESRQRTLIRAAALGNIAANPLLQELDSLSQMALGGNNTREIWVNKAGLRAHSPIEMPGEQRPARCELIAVRTTVQQQEAIALQAPNATHLTKGYDIWQEETGWTCRSSYTIVGALTEGKELIDARRIDLDD